MLGAVAGVRLSRGSRRLTVSLRDDAALGDGEREALVRALSERLPGLSILLDAPPSDRAERRACRFAAAAERAGLAPRPAARQMAAQPARPAAGSDAVLFGSTIRTSQRTPVHELSEGEATAVIQGVLVSVEMKEGWKGRDGRVSYRVQLNVTDHTDSIYCVCTFPEEKRAQRLYERLRGLPGTREQVIVRGVCRVPKYAKEPYLFVNDINAAPAKYREDTGSAKARWSCTSIPACPPWTG